MPYRPHASTIGAVFALLLIPIAAYTGAYFYLPYARTNYGDHTVVAFPKHWQPALFKPAAAIEGFLIGRDVIATPPRTLNIMMF
jgi:hypothetical protein